MKKETMKEAIENLHHVYYSIDPFESRESFMQLHHALEHCFNAAEIDSTHTAYNGRNAELFEMAAEGKPAPVDAIESWDLAERGILKKPEKKV